MFMTSLPAIRPALVMPGLVPGIHVFLPQQQKQDVDGRDKPGHDRQMGRIRLREDAK